MQGTHSSKIKPSAEAEKKSNFLLQKLKSATCRTNLEVPQTGKKKKKAINWNLTINESFGF